MNTTATKTRQYKVWVKGRRISTETSICAARKSDAVMTFANRLSLKSFQCDGVLVRPEGRA